MKKPDFQSNTFAILYLVISTSLVIFSLNVALSQKSLSSDLISKNDSFIGESYYSGSTETENKKDYNSSNNNATDFKAGNSNYCQYSIGDNPICGKSCNNYDSLCDEHFEYLYGIYKDFTG